MASVAPESSDRITTQDLEAKFRELQGDITETAASARNTLVVVGGSFQRCPQPGRALLKPGRSFDGCSVVLLPRDARPGRVRFQGDVAKDPVYWRTGA